MVATPTTLSTHRPAVMAQTPRLGDLGLFVQVSTEGPVTHSYILIEGCPPGVPQPGNRTGTSPMISERSTTELVPHLFIQAIYPSLKIAHLLIIWQIQLSKELLTYSITES